MNEDGTKVSARPILVLNDLFYEFVGNFRLVLNAYSQFGFLLSCYNRWHIIPLWADNICLWPSTELHFKNSTHRTKRKNCQR